MVTQAAITGSRIKESLLRGDIDEREEARPSCLRCVDAVPLAVSAGECLNNGMLAERNKGIRNRTERHLRYLRELEKTKEQQRPDLQACQAYQALRRHPRTGRLFAVAARRDVPASDSRAPARYTVPAWLNRISASTPAVDTRN